MPGDHRSDDEVAPTLAGEPPSDAATPAGSTDATLPASSPGAAAGDGQLLPGHTLGRYEIEGLLGRGGMGEVYAAYDPNLDRPVAVKVLLGGVRDEAAAARLVREAQALARLQHPNVVAVFDAGEDRGRVFLAMQYVEGETLAAHLRGRTRPWQEVLALFVEAGRGLAAAHAAGIVHRDFKPSNVLIDRAGHVAVTDFGLARDSPESITSESGRRAARSAGASGSRRGMRASDPVLSMSARTTPTGDLTRQGELVGTPAYMPVEQVAGAAITAATDQFAFCVALWEALYGEHPFLEPGADGSALAYVAAIERGEIRTPASTPVPRRVVAALSRGLARQASARWPSMDALLAELAARPRRRRVWPIVVGALVVAGGAVAIAVALRGDPPPSCEATARTRAEAIWNPTRADAITARFTATDRPYAATAAARVRHDLDGYAWGWTTAAVDACTASRGDAGERARTARRVACVDRAHAALAATIGVLADASSGEIVDASAAVVSALPPIQDCTGDDAIGAPPPAIERRLADLDGRLQVAAARRALGQPRIASEQLDSLARDSADLGWEPFQVRLAYERGLVAADLLQPAYAALIAVAERARRLGLHRLELHAAEVAMLDADDDAALDAAVSTAVAAAGALGGAEASLSVGIAHGEGLNNRRKFLEASSVCRDGKKVAHDHHWEELEDRAATCLLRALLPLSRYGELGPLVDEQLATVSTRLGAEHPQVALLLQMQSNILLNQGKVADATAALERAGAILKRAFGDRDIRVAAVTRNLGGIAIQQEDYVKGQTLLEDALSIIESQTPPPDGELAQTHRDLGMFWMESRKFDKVRYHFDQAIAAATRQTAADSLEVAFLLVMYGQYQTAWDVETGLATLRRAIALFDAHHDPRGAVARGVLGSTLMMFHRAADAIALLEDALANANVADTPPILLGQMEFQLAQALLADKRAPVHARQHAEAALTDYANAGELSRREEVRDWIRDKHLPPYKSNAELRALGTPIREHEHPDDP